MIQQYGRSSTGRVRHIVQSKCGLQNGSRTWALCGAAVMVIPLGLTVGDTCKLCMKNPKFNKLEDDDAMVQGSHKRA